MVKVHGHVWEHVPDCMTAVRLGWEQVGNYCMTVPESMGQSSGYD